MKLFFIFLCLITITFFIILVFQYQYFKKRLLKKSKSLEKQINKAWIDFKNERAKEFEGLQCLAEIGRLAGGIFHDLINPLSALILGLEETRLHDLSKVKESEWNKKINEANVLCQRMTRLLRAANKQIVADTETKDWFSVNEEIRGVLSLLACKAQTYKVALRSNLNPEIYLNQNALKFSRIICNLVSNAIEAVDTNKKSSWVEVKMRLADKHLLIDVNDNGRGFPNHLKNKLFEPFFSTKKSEANLGLGLTIVLDLITKNFAGELRVLSQAEKFTTFTVDLPLKAEDVRVGRI